tara:strand:+ start:5431 stop:5664 length:234 start_codon:yes stop_codon:yes gene_type:complete
MKQNINQDIALAIFNSTDKPSQSRNIVSLREKVEAYAKQKVIEELERLKSDCDAGDDAYSFAMSKHHQKRIQQLKQD